MRGTREGFAAPGLPTVAALAATMAILYAAREVLIPLAMAVLISFVLQPAVRRLERSGSSRVAAVFLVVALSLAAIGALGYLVGEQIVDLASRLPEYKDNIVRKALALRGSGADVIGKANQTIREVNEQIAEAAERPAAKPVRIPMEPADEPEPQPVRVIEPPPTTAAILQSAVLPMLAPLGHAAIVLVFVVFILLEHEDLRNRLIRLIGAGGLSVATDALDDAAGRVSRYIQMLCLINGLFGAAVAVGLWYIGLANALLWGLLAGVLRFIPYVGAWAAASLPIALSLAVSDGWWQPVATLSLFIVLEFLAFNVIEPLLYGQGAGLSKVAVLAAAVFWGWMWGGVGLILSTPLTVLLAVTGRYVPQFEFLNVMLSDERVLPPDVHLYQRLLAMDPGEAFDAAREHLREHSLADLYDSVLIPALRLAEEDRVSGALSEERRIFVYQSLRDLLEDISLEMEDVEAKPPAQASRGTILCVPARNEADEIAGLMLAHLLRAEGFEVRGISWRQPLAELPAAVRESNAAAVVVSALPPSTVMHARRICRRVRAASAAPKIVAGIWDPQTPLDKGREALMAAGADGIATTFAAAVDGLAGASQMAA